jgi:hypothetical protein
MLVDSSDRSEGLLDNRLTQDLAGLERLEEVRKHEGVLRPTGRLKLRGECGVVRSVIIMHAS